MRTLPASQTATAPAGAIPYAERLGADLEWALTEASRYFEKTGAVHDTLRRVARRLDELGIPYAVAGGLALFRHGYRRFTEDVGLLVAPADLERIHRDFTGRGYLPRFPKSKNLRDTETGVTVEFLLAGEFPGDGAPKPVAFPEPAAASSVVDGIRYLNLAPLIELKLASGMTAPGRLRDLSDVGELIRTLGLPESFQDQLNPFVRECFRTLHREATAPGADETAPWLREA